MDHGISLSVLVLLAIFGFSSALDNGLSLTPPMGWLTWERFRCQTDCVNYPTTCISERLIKEMASKMVSEGYANFGYEYIIIDDCWMTHERGANDTLVADPDRFPSGIKALTDYIHELGLKFGIYEDLGTTTCGGYPGSLNYKEVDANTFAAWGVDYVKFDGCASDPADFDTGYPEFGRFLNATGRPIFYACEWPLYQQIVGITPNYTAIRETCNLWRNYFDIEDSYDSYIGTVNWYGDNQDKFANFSGPGGWNDPDMLIIGNFALSLEESKAQMAMWAIMAAPLIMSNDLRDISLEMKAILQNAEVIKVNQDALGIQGRRIYNNDNIQIWTRPVEPVVNGKHSHAVVVLSQRSDGTLHRVNMPLADIGVSNSDRFIVSELFGAFNSYEVAANGTLDVLVPPSGARMIKYQVKSNITQFYDYEY